MKYRLEDRGEFAVVGVEEKIAQEEAFSRVPGMWANAAKQGLFEQLWEIRSGEPAIPGILGVCAEGEWGRADEFAYVMGIVSGEEPPAGMGKRQFAASSWVVFEADRGSDGIPGVWNRFYTEWLPGAAYELADLPAVECYLPPEEDHDELWIPVVSKRG